MHAFSLIIIGASVSMAICQTVETQSPLGVNPMGGGSGTNTTQAAKPEQEPPKVPLECGNTYVPVSEQDIYVMSQQDAKNGTQTDQKEKVDVSKLSQDKNMAICETATGGKTGLCDVSTCQVPQVTVCTQCTEVNKDSPDFAPAAGATPVEKMQCDSGYVLKTPENKQAGNICMTKTSAFTCAGERQGVLACNKCVTEDSAPKA
uniref:Secreted protein n=1 Tax=Puccinia striiformis f. sp. tritici TaxID=168172 RepID=D2KC79_9BASI|nr:secreted protein [Puccinia striiformis f. sp. tritici]